MGKRSGFFGFPGDRARPAVRIERPEHPVPLPRPLPRSRSRLATAAARPQARPEAGVVATTAALLPFDTEGSPFVCGPTAWTSKGQEPTASQGPYGEVVVARPGDPTAQGGAPCWPLDKDARSLRSATPRFAHQLSPKDAARSGGKPVEDWASNPGRAGSRAFVQELAAAVGRGAQAQAETGPSQTPRRHAAVQTIRRGRDGPCALRVADGGRPGMVGTGRLDEAPGERPHPRSSGAPPEPGPATFYHRLQRAIEPVPPLDPPAWRTGVAAGAQDQWDVLGQDPDDPGVDFDPAAGSGPLAAPAADPRQRRERAAGVAGWGHRRKHERGAARQFLAERAPVASRE